MKKYPIAERFLSVQGEGLYTGTPMYFIRFAGCSVGKKITTEEGDALRCSVLDSVPIYREKCTIYDGREFICDTDFRTKEVMTVDEIVASIPTDVRRVCLTGGEPLDQPLSPLLDVLAFHARNISVHIETSGTKDIVGAYESFSYADLRPEDDGGWIWLTVSPKKGALPLMLRQASEIKLLVDGGFDVSKLPTEVLEHDLVWIQPVNELNEIDQTNLQRCLDLLREHPSWRLSMQAHKIWKVR